jgi:hypothetical protein
VATLRNEANFHRDSELEIYNYKLDEWDSVLKRWLGIIHKWCESIEDTPYAKTTVLEETLTSLLSSAAISVDCLSAVELPMFKSHTVNGRNDLFVRFPTSDNDYYAEAKFISIGQGNPFNDININLDKACKNVLEIDFKTQGISKYISLGLLFISPTYHRLDKIQVSEEINKTLAVIKSMKIDAAAWCFPEGRRQYRVGNNEDWPFNPGVILIMKIASKD